MALGLVAVVVVVVVVVELTAAGAGAAGLASCEAREQSSVLHEVGRLVPLSRQSVYTWGPLIEQSRG